ncbi:a-factor receptor [Stygiomarasmius scandens]|uniref:A-factor receptor n=1 Tax=Marasmiellus scandens TaxID=2682957 RepID=A0ABR1J9R5_9AGAR
MSSAVIDILFSVLSFLAFGLLLIPLPWHLKARNAGTCLFISWIGLACLVLAVDSILWRTQRDLTGPIFTWCDISTKLIIGAMAAVPAVSLCINLRLYFISTDRITILEKKSLLITELALGLGFPIVEMALHFVVQGRRFELYGGMGCRPFISNVLLSYILLFAPQILLGIGSCILLVLTTIASRDIYKKINLLHPGIDDHEGSSLTFLWFLTLGGLSALCSIAFDGYWIYATLASSGMKVWVPWNEMHNTSRVDTITQSTWRSNSMASIMLQIDRWIYVGLGLLFFAFFGFTAEARRRYKRFLGCGGKAVEEQDELTDQELTMIMKSRNLKPLNGPEIIDKPGEAFGLSRSATLPPLEERPGSFHANEIFNNVKERITKQSKLAAPPSLMSNDTTASVIYSTMPQPENPYSSNASTSTPYLWPSSSRSSTFPSPSSPPNLPLPPIPDNSIESSSPYRDSQTNHSVYSTSTLSTSASSLPLISKTTSTATTVSHGPPPDVLPPARFVHTQSPLVMPVQRSRSFSASPARTYGGSSSTEVPTEVPTNRQHRRSKSAYRSVSKGAQSSYPQQSSLDFKCSGNNELFSDQEMGVPMAI